MTVSKTADRGSIPWGCANITQRGERNGVFCVKYVCNICNANFYYNTRNLNLSNKRLVSSVGLECRPVTPEVRGSSPLRVAKNEVKP